MKYCILLLMILFVFYSCSESKEPEPLCENPCLKDSLKFSASEHPLQPYIYLSVSDCAVDTIIWSYKGLGVNRKYAFTDFINKKILFDRDKIAGYVRDTSIAWLIFNDCTNGRGYFLRIPFNKSQNIRGRGSALNSFDPKFAVAEGLVAYTDRGNIFVEDMFTGKTAMMTFGKETDMDYDYIHDTLDSVHITPTRIWARVKIDKEWEDREKEISLK